MVQVSALHLAFFAITCSLSGMLLGINACESTDADGDEWTVAEGDCNDGDPSIYPGAQEQCDQLDNDCDGVADDDLVCEGCVAQSFNGVSCLFCTDPESWQHAEENCASVGRTLVTINDSSEDSWLQNTAVSYVSSGYGWWSGLSDHEQEGSFVWTNGDPLSYTNWDGGEPNNSGDEDCVTFLHLDVYSFHWNDLNCSVEIPYVCE